MILCVSTSSPVASVALLSPDGGLVASQSRESPRGASGAVIALAEGILGEKELSFTEIDRFIVDVGPGSFTGVKVGLAMVKAWGYARQAQVAGISAFDLVDPHAPVALPSRRGESYLRVPGESPLVVPSGDLPTGTIMGIAPDAAVASESFTTLIWMEAAVLTGNYVSEPSISQPKRLLIMGGPSDGE